jgi:hypothetical protein
MADGFQTALEPGQLKRRVRALARTKMNIERHLRRARTPTALPRLGEEIERWG